MDRLAKQTSRLFYGAALAFVVSVNIYLFYIHAPLWASGKFIVGAFTGLLLILSLAAAGVFWGVGVYVRKNGFLDKLLLIAFLVSMLWFFMPSRFSID